jgi:hypothetical protein
MTSSYAAFDPDMLHSPLPFGIQARWQGSVGCARGLPTTPISFDTLTFCRGCGAQSRCASRGLKQESSRPKTVQAQFDQAKCEALGALLHQSPRTFGKPTSIWTLELAAEVSFEQGLTTNQVSIETIRQALKRLGVGWQRAKDWITSPDPHYAQKKKDEML